MSISRAIGSQGGQRALSRAGQVFTTDFLISAMLFVVILNVSFLMWNEAYAQQDRLTDQYVLQQDVNYLASLLVRTPGYPEDWTAANVEILGLADPDHVVQEEKLSELDSMTTDEIGAAMDLSRSEFVINVTNESGTMWLNGNDLVWGTPPTDADHVVTAQRSVVVNATNLYQRGTVQVVLWR